MTASTLLYSAFGKPAVPNVESASGRCLLCGEVLTAGVPRKRVIKPTFTNRDIFAYPPATHLCCACAFALGEPAIRRTSFICAAQEFRPLKRDALSAALFNLPKEPYLFVITTSYKKHLWLHAAVNVVPHICNVQFDEIAVRLYIDQANLVLNVLEVLYSTFTKEEIATGNYQVHRIQRFGIERFERYERQIQHLRGSPALKLLLYTVNRKEIESCPNELEEQVPASSISQTKPPKAHTARQLQLF